MRWFHKFLKIFLPKKELTNSVRRSPLVKEFIGLVLAACSFIILLSLISFSELDMGLKIGHADFHNWLGPLGAFISETFFSFFGIFAFCIPCAGFYLALRSIFSLRDIFAFSHWWGLCFIVLGVSPIIAHFAPLAGSKFLVSGVIGQVITELLLRYVSLGGLLIFSSTIITFGLILITRKPILGQSFLFFLWPFKKLLALRLRMPNFMPATQKIKSPELTKPSKSHKDLASELSSNIPAKKELLPENQAKNSIAIINSGQKVNSNILKKAEKELGGREYSFALPPFKLLDYDEPTLTPINQDKLKEQADKLTQAFLQFGIDGSIREIRPGPVVTNYEFVPAPGIKLSKIAALSDDIAMAMAAIHIRIVTPIPGKGAVGIEVPNDKRETVYLKEIVASEKYRDVAHKLCMAVGKTVEGTPYFMNLAEMPHVLIAGTTGSGKSVSVNSMICSILYRATPQDVRFIMIDPKMLELSIYKGIPHLLLPPIIDPKKAANALKWAVKEMDIRYKLMKEAVVRDIDSYNQKITQENNDNLKPVDGRAHEHLPYIVIVIDEYADLLMVAGKEVEGHIMRLAQKARACGIHMMLATQRPSVDVITGVIKANFPVRMGFRLASNHDSKTIINKTGAEKLLGKGDVLIMPPGTSDLIRVHGAFISEKELTQVVVFLSKERAPIYYDNIADFVEKTTQESDSGTGNADNFDSRFEDAVNIVKEHQRCSTSFVQRQLCVGYNRAARIVEQMEKAGVVGPVLNAKGERDIFVEASPRS